ncbi:uncharacterized protein LOC123217391 [Mangifera indica]|uniref:uncharacterized protein LOC123217391 n=1 Tax=Mangifera indica TaxID=29780 RepID=UPI001CFA312D|nr:uncharacterized protein LOC123217391 [Mangifera indica]
MRTFYKGWWISAAILLLAMSLSYSQGVLNENQIKTAVFLSPKFVLGPGSVENRYYYNINFPRGHISLKSFNAEVIDEAGNPVPLHETYLHHWVVARYYGHVEYNDSRKPSESDYFIVRNDGICQKGVLGQYFGLGSETRGTATHIPDPYGIEIGNPADIPEGYEERWLLNVHAIDTRGVEDKLGCTECRCDLYNITVDEYGRPLRPDYAGGLRCCYDQTQCRVRHGFEGATRSLYLRYTVKWVEWDSSLVPVKIYIFDITDKWKRFNDSTGLSTEHDCRVEYDIEPCSATDVADHECINTKRISLTMPTGGYVIYGVAHQHSGGIGSALYREDGKAICSSIPAYGDGIEAGNEAGYIVGMSTCYPQPGSVKITDGETLILESNYSSTRGHTGVMGLFYILVADQVPEPEHLLHLPVKMYDKINRSAYVGAAIVLVGIVSAVAIVQFLFRNKVEDEYQPIMT